MYGHSYEFMGIVVREWNILVIIKSSDYGKRIIGACATFG